VINSAPERMWARFPFYAVIKRATSKKRYGSESKDAGSYSTTKFASNGHKY